MQPFHLRGFAHTPGVCRIGAFSLPIAALVLLSTRDAQAQGFGVFEQGACAMGRAETGVAQPCDDGSAIFYNPGGLNGGRSFTVNGSATGVGGNFGVEIQANDRVAFGARFMTPITFHYGGDAAFEPMSTGLVIPAGSPLAGPPLNLPPGTPLDALFEATGTFADGGTLEDQGIETEITMPAQFVAGVSVRATRRLTLLADYQWTGWSRFDVIALAFDNPALNHEQIENYEDTNAIRLGVEYGVGRAWTLRTGYLFNQSAAPDQAVTPLLPEADRNHVTAGVTWQPSDRLTVNVAYQFLGQNDRRGRVRDLPSEDTPVGQVNSGLYRFNGHLFGTTLTLHF